MTFGAKLKNLRQEFQMTQLQLANALKLSKANISKYESDFVQPSHETLMEIAKLFSVSIDYLLGNTTTQSPLTTKIPVLGRVAAGIPIEAITDIEDYEEITEDMAALGEYAALRIHGDSMEPKMSDGDIVIVRIQQDVNSGDTAIVMVNGSDATCKKIKKTPEGILLMPTNPAYEPIYYSNKQIAELPVTIFGKVVELRAKF